MYKAAQTELAVLDGLPFVFVCRFVLSTTLNQLLYLCLQAM